MRKKKIDRKTHEENMRHKYGGATVWIGGRRVMFNGTVEDEEWWKEKMRS